MKIYTQELEIPTYLCDRHDRLFTWAAVRLCQEVSEMHSKATGLGYEELLQKNLVWIISRAYYIIYRRANASEKVMLSTWSRGNTGLFAIRDYEMRSTAGEVLMTGTTYWPLIDHVSHKPIRLSHLMDGYECHDLSATDRTELERLRLPDMSQPDGELRLAANYSIVDHVGHVNNAEYVKMIFDSLVQVAFNIDRPFALELNYNHETPFGDMLSVLRKQDNGAEWFQITNSRGLGVSAKVSRP